MRGDGDPSYFPFTLVLSFFLFTHAALVKYKPLILSKVKPGQMGFQQFINQVEQLKKQPQPK